MAEFEKNKFRQAAAYVYYGDKFVARFKYQKSAVGSFIKFLREHFTVEEYFDRIEAGESPLKIVESKGYLLPTIRRFLREHGYDDTMEGYNQYRFDSNRRMTQ
jgi:hypothetical protein